MKTLFLLLLIFLGDIVMANEVNIKITDIKVQRGGQIIVYLFSEKGFPKHHESALEKIYIKDLTESLTVHFKNVPNVFAIKILHDEDSNEKVTKNWTGIYPKEGLGFSNNQKIGVFGPPTFKQCSVNNKDLSEELNISLTY